jgi:tetratricopeptide (TPR) repeat protein
MDKQGALDLAKQAQILLELKDPDLLDEAEDHLRRALALAPGSATVLTQLGRVFGAQGRFNEGLACFKQAIGQAPRDVSIRLSVAELLSGCGRFDEAERVLAGAELLDSNDARLHAQLGKLAIARGRFAEAGRHFRAALALDTTLAEARSGLGLALEGQGQFDEAENCFLDALSSNPSLTAPLIALAKLQADRGDFEESCRSARQALTRCPNLAEAYWRLAMNLKAALPDSDIRAIERLRDHKYVSHGLRAGLGFALGAVFDARGLYDQAAEHFAAANAVKAAVKVAKGQSFDPDQYSVSIDRIITTFTPVLLVRCRGWGDPDPRPVFVVGLPRSGTTLVEQILSSHSQVHGAGELRDALNLFNALPELTGRPGIDAFEAASTLGPDSARAVARRYIAALDRLAPSTAQCVVDKMPDNFLMLGLIAMLWPEARVIVCRRDLRDIALSCWQTPFSTNPWTNQWEHIARRFADHQRLLAHWNRAKPVAWLDVSYEELVRDVEGHARRMIAFLGLEWEPGCLEFHKTQRVVRTASQVQVREPIHTHSVGRWQRYESTLQPLIEAFKRFGVVPEEGASAYKFPLRNHGPSS